MNKEQSVSSKKSLFNIKSLLVLALFSILLFALSVSSVLAGQAGINSTFILNASDDVDFDNFFYVNSTQNVNVTFGIRLHFDNGIEGPPDDNDLNRTQVNVSCGVLGDSVVVRTANFVNADQPDAYYKVICTANASVLTDAFTPETVNFSVFWAPPMPPGSPLQFTGGQPNNVILYNFTVPPMPSDVSNWTRFGPLMTDLSTVTDFNNVPYIIHVLVNVTDLSPGGSGWTDFRSGAQYNFASLDMTHEDIPQQLPALRPPTGINVNISSTSLGSNIFLNSSALGRFNTSVVLTVFGLPFRSLPNVTTSDGGAINTSYSMSYLYDAGLRKGNLTFKVDHFTTYNITDQIAPIITVNSPSAGQTTQTLLINVTFNGTSSSINNNSIIVTVTNSTDTVATYNYSNLSCTGMYDDELITCNRTSILLDGTYNVTFNVTDLGAGAGNSASSPVNNVKIDATAPTWNPLPANQSLELGSAFSYDANATDASTITYSINDSTNFAVVSGTGVITNNTILTVRVYSLRINATDVSGNVNSTIILINVSDTTKPVWTPLPANQTLELGAAFSYDANATDLQAITYTINDTTNFAVSGIGVITNSTALVVKVYGLQINATDASGNANSTIILINVSDTIAPAWSPLPANQTVDYGNSFSYDANATDASTITYSINDSTNFAVVAGTGVITNNTALNVQVYGLRINATDVSGNVNSTIILINVSDTTKPLWSPLPANQTVEVGNAFSYDANATDLQTIVYSINDSANFAVVAGTGVITNNTALNVQVYGLRINATDVSGNVNSTIILINVSDTQVPVVTLINPITAQGTDSITFTFNVTDNNVVPTMNCLLYLNGVYNASNASIVANVAQQSFGVKTLTTDATYNWTVGCTDPAGNSANSSTVIFTKDSNPPSMMVNATSSASVNQSQPVNIFTTWDYGVANISAGKLYVNGVYNSTNSTPQNGVINGNVSFTYVTSAAQAGSTLLFSVVVNDTAGLNSTYTSNMSVLVNDTQVPVVTLISPTAGQAIGTSNVTFSFNGTDNNINTTLNCSLYISGIYNQSQTITSGTASNSFTAVALSDNSYTWNVTCTDAAGLIGVTAPIAFTKDNTAPTIITNATSSASVNQSQPVNIFTSWSYGVNNVSAGKLYVNGVYNATNSTPQGGANVSFTYTTTAAQAGSTLLFSVVVNDTAGLNSTYTSNMSVLVNDTIAPVTVLSSPANNYNTSANSFNFSAVVTDNNVAPNISCNITIGGTSYGLTISGVNGSTLSYTANISALSGSVLWNFTCWDQSNNLNVSTTTRTLVIDRTKPLFPVAAIVSDNYIKNDQTVTFTVNSSDAGVGVQTIALSSASLSLSSSPQVLSSGSTSNGVWNVSTTISGTEGVYNVTVTSTDFVGNSNTTLVQLTLDNTVPNISGVTANGQALSTSSSSAPNITEVNGDINISWTVVETNLNLTNVSVDSVVQNNVTNGSLVLITSLASGLKTVSFTALDNAGNPSSAVYYFKINGVENTTAILSTLNSSAGSAVQVITLSDADSGNDLSHNMTFLNATYDMDINVTVGASTVEVTIPNFSGLNVDWNKTFVINTSMPAASSTAVGVLGTNITQLVFFTGFENFLGAGSYAYAEILFKVNVTALGLDVVYFSTDSALVASKVTTICNSASTTLPCYDVVIPGYTRLWIPHFSGGGLANDTIAPQITLTYPSNNSNYIYSYNINFTGTINESSVPTDIDTMCVYGINTTTPTLPVHLILSSGSTYTFSFSNTSAALLNGDYYVKFNCTDTKNNSRALTHNFRVNDTTATVISTPSSSVTSTTSTITFSVDEPANYSVNYGTTSALGTTSASSTKSVSSKSVSLSSLTASTLYYYNITVCDTNAYCVTNGTYSFTTSAASSTSSSGGGGGGAASTTSNVGSSVSHGWTNVVAGAVSTMSVNKTSIPVTELSFTAADGISSASVTVAVLIDAPNDTKVLASKVYKYLKVTEAGFTDADVSGAVLKFKVAKSWLTENSVSADSVVLSRYTSDWSELTTEMLSEDDSFVYFKATSPGMSYFAVTLKAGTVVTEKPATPAEEKNETVATETTEGAAGEQNEVAAGEQVVPTTQPPTTTTPPAKKGSAWLIVLVVVVLGLAVFLFMKSRKKK